MVSLISSSARFSKLLYLAVFIAGAVTALAFAPFNIYPLAWFGPAFLFFTLTKVNTKRQYFYLSWIYGLGLFGVGASWPFYSLYYFAHAPLFIAVSGTVLFVVVVAFFSTGFFGLIASLFRYRTVFSQLLFFFPASWVIVEWFRSWFLTGFPWLYLGNSQIDFVFSSFAPLTGVLGVSFICVLIAGSLVGFYFRGSSLSKVASKDVSHIDESYLGFSVRVWSALVIVFLLTSSILLQSINWTKKIGEPLSVSVLQSNISQTEKLKSENLIPSIKLYQEMTLQSSESDLIVWPETALFDSFDRHMKSVIEPIQKSLKDSKKAILIGGFFVNDEQGVENSVLAITAESRSLYSKKHLVPFGEYTPLLKYLRWLSKWIQLPYDNISAGINGGSLKINDYTAQMTICYEDAFGQEMIKALPKSTLLINVTHDGWFTGSFEAEQHMQIARMRSLEMGRYMVRATTTGPSGIIDEKGKLVATATTYSKAIISHEVQHFSGATPYVRWGDWLIIGMLSALLLVGVFWKKET